MKRITFEIAKAIKKAGYPQKCGLWYNKKGVEFSYTEDYSDCYARPTYVEVWFWLWREKKIKFSLEPNDDFAECYNSKDFGYLISKICDDPEDAIEQVIKYLVENDILK